VERTSQDDGHQLEIGNEQYEIVGEELHFMTCL